MNPKVAERIREIERRNKERYLRPGPTEFYYLLAILKAQREALEFYADRDNWDTDDFSPTIWDDGAIDLGKRAQDALNFDPDQEEAK
jgi:hypothetical protein